MDYLIGMLDNVQNHQNVLVCCACVEVSATFIELCQSLHNKIYNIEVLHFLQTDEVMLTSIKRDHQVYYYN